MTKSERENLLNSASRMLFQFSSLLAATEPESPEHTEYMRICEELAHLKWGVLSSRYLNSSVPVEKDFGYRELLYRMPDSDFKQATRMTQSSFLFLLQNISNHPVFTNNSRNGQHSVAVQLAIALERLGCDGNGASVKRIAIHFGISPGSVNNFTWR